MKISLFILSIMKRKPAAIESFIIKSKTYDDYLVEVGQKLAEIQQHNYEAMERYVLSRGEIKGQFKGLDMSFTLPNGQKVRHHFGVEKLFDEFERWRFDQETPYLAPPPSPEEKMAIEARELEAAYAWENGLWEDKRIKPQAPEEELPFYPLEHVYSDLNDLMIYSEPNLMTEEGIPANGRYQNGLITINKDLLNPERHAEAIGTLFEEYGEHQVEMGNKDFAQHIDKGALIGQQLLNSLINEASQSPEGHVTVPVTIDGQRHRLTATAEQLKAVTHKNFTQERINNPLHDEDGRYQVDPPSTVRHPTQAQSLADDQQIENEKLATPYEDKVGKEAKEKKEQQDYKDIEDKDLSHFTKLPDEIVKAYYSFFSKYTKLPARALLGGGIMLGLKIYESGEDLGTAHREDGLSFTLNAPKAFYHWLFGEGTPLKVSFNDAMAGAIKENNITVDKFEDFSYVCSNGPGIYEVDELVLGVDTKGDRNLIFGNVLFKFQGEIIVSKGKWKAKGIYKCYDDKYDFNPSDHRPRHVEFVIRRIYYNIPGEDFFLEIRGHQATSEEGYLDHQKIEAAKRQSGPSEPKYTKFVKLKSFDENPFNVVQDAKDETFEKDKMFKKEDPIQDEKDKLFKW